MNKIHNFMHKLHNPELGILFIRLSGGIVFVHAGYLKLMNMGFVVQSFGAAGIPAWLAYLVAYCELIGGLLVLSGLFVRYAGVVLSIIMLVAIFLVHFPHGYGLQNGGFEYALALLFVNLALITLGAGKYSLAKMCKKNQENSI